MATPSEIRAVADTMAGLVGRFRNCKETALAIIETGPRWWKTPFVWDYWHARYELMKSMKCAIKDIARIRSASPGPQLIRAAFHLSQLRECCKRCDSHNRRTGHGFLCLAEEEMKKSAEYLPRFQLDERGQILERD